jgi:hypothetical protein
MRIIIADNVSRNPKWFPILDVLAMYVDSERHGFDSIGVIDLLNSEWILKRPTDVADLVRLSVLSRSNDSFIDASAVVIDELCPPGGIVDFDNSKTTLHPLDAIYFLSTPFQVILENEYFDGAFLLWSARAVGYFKFIDAYRCGKFSFRHAGGKDSLERSAKTFSHGVWSRRDESYSRALRLWMAVVLDNDAKHSKHFPNKYIIASTKNHVSFVHQLAKRSIESYIPNRFIEKILKPKQFYALKNLNPEQKRHFHMKKGFRFEKNESPTLPDFKQSNKISKGEKDLFGTISPADWQVLCSGFGSGLSAIFTDEKYRPNPNTGQIFPIDDHLELIDLLKKIYSRI